MCEQRALRCVLRRFLSQLGISGTWNTSSKGPPTSTGRSAHGVTSSIRAQRVAPGGGVTSPWNLQAQFLATCQNAYQNALSSERGNFEKCEKGSVCRESKNGSDGTRTRDLRRDRPLPRSRRMTTMAVQSLYS
jgi:hypothetical protein